MGLYNGSVTELLPARSESPSSGLERQRGERTAEWSARVIDYVLPRDEPGDRYGYRSLTKQWLDNFTSAHTREAYQLDLGRWLAWCAINKIDPFQARRRDGDSFVTAMKQTIPPPAPRSINRRLSAVSSWYTYLCENEAADRNPIPGKGKRPKVSDESNATGLSANEAQVFNNTANQLGARNAALLLLMHSVGARVSEVCNADLEQLIWKRGHRVFVIRGKGGKTREAVLVPFAAEALDRYVGERAAAAGLEPDELRGPMFVTDTGKRVDRWYVADLMRRTALTAGIKSAPRLHPHDLRHAFATLSLDAGATLRDVQDALGHADPRTTRRYDRSRGKLERHPAYLLASQLAPDHDEEPA